MANQWFASPDRAVHESGKLMALLPCLRQEVDWVSGVGASRVRDLIEQAIERQGVAKSAYF
jgi:hypothetical protein